VSLKSFDFTPP